MEQPGTSGSSDAAMTPNLIMINVIESGPNGPKKMPLGKICPLCNEQCRYYLLNQRFKVETCENVQCDFPYRTGELNLMREEFCLDKQMNRRRLPARIVSEEETRKLAIAGAKEIYRSKVLLRRRLMYRTREQDRTARG